MFIVKGKGPAGILDGMAPADSWRCFKRAGWMVLFWMLVGPKLRLVLLGEGSTQTRRNDTLPTKRSGAMPPEREPLSKP